MVLSKMPISTLIIGKTTYGETFSCAVAKDNFMGVQFHPEKSSHAGSKLLENFLKNF